MFYKYSHEELLIHAGYSITMSWDHGKFKIQLSHAQNIQLNVTCEKLSEGMKSAWTIAGKPKVINHDQA